MYLLKDKVIVVTGASTGIGAALAMEALKRGAKVAVCARNMHKLNAAFAGADSERLLLYAADVSREADCKSFIEAVTNKWAGADVLINNAGVSMRALFEDTELQVIKELMDINFWGAVY